MPERSGVVKGKAEEEEVSSLSLLLLLLLSEARPSSFKWGGEMPVVDLDLISIIVLLVKHVHLQNVGAARRGISLARKK